MMLSIRRVLGVAALVAGALVLAPLPSFADGKVTRTVLKRVDLTGVEGLEVITTLIEAEPGASIPRHSHHGDEFLYVLEGGTTQAPGKDPVSFEAGQTVHFPRGVVHGGFTVIGDKAIKGLTVHIVDKGKSLVVPAE